MPLKFARRNITVLVGNEGDGTTRKLQADVCGAWAVHPTINNEDGVHPWTVTFIHTGLSLASFRSEWDAKLYLFKMYKARPKVLNATKSDQVKLHKDFLKQLYDDVMEDPPF